MLAEDDEIKDITETGDRQGYHGYYYYHYLFWKNSLANFSIVIGITIFPYGIIYEEVEKLRSNTTLLLMPFLPSISLP
jgi:hypothetical protein